MRKIEWTQETWNPIVACSKVSPGCDNCYAERQAYRNMLCLGAAQGPAGPTYEAYECAVAYEVADPNHDHTPVKSLGWSGWTFLIEEVLQKPLKRKKPTMYFVCSMSDLFHEDTSFEDIDKVFAVMALCQQHTFQILTKRPMRMLEYMTQLKAGARFVGKAATKQTSSTEAGDVASGRASSSTPMLNVWLGVSAENQEYADKRIPILLDCPAAVRFVSVEPMLGPVRLDTLCAAEICNGRFGVNALYPEAAHVDWVICGCESGPGRRPMSVDWAIDLRRQCKEWSVPFFMKQMNYSNSDKVNKGICGFPEYLRVREWPEVQA